jgi:Mrp family chromosome partitioning ATPase
MPEFSVRISDTDLRRSGHISPGPPEAVQTREEFRAIKKHIISNIAGGNEAGGRDRRVVVVTSARPGEGKTFVALNLALSLAIDREIGVTLVDGDAIGRGLTQKLSLGPSAGLLDVLDRDSGDISSVVQDTNVGNLGIIPAGRARSDGSELLSGARMQRVLSSLVARTPNHVVVLDTGSLLSGSSPVVLSSYSGQAVFVVACGETGRSLVDESLTLLDAHIGPLEFANLGLVLNKISPAQSAARYSANPT